MCLRNGALTGGRKLIRSEENNERIIEWRRMPAVIRCDNGPENISGLIRAWVTQCGIRVEYTQPDKQRNAGVERFNRTVRYEWLSQYHWSCFLFQGREFFNGLLSTFETAVQHETQATHPEWSLAKRAGQFALASIRALVPLAPLNRNMQEVSLRRLAQQ